MTESPNRPEGWPDSAKGKIYGEQVAAGHQRARISSKAENCRVHDPAFLRWSQGYGVLNHEDLTQVRIHEMVESLLQREILADRDIAYSILQAADVVASAAMWLVVHMTYARTVDIDGLSRTAEDFKLHPEGHTGGALNMVPAYVGYLVANALTGQTRSWLMGQGHCVAAIDAVNLIVDNMSYSHSQRYSFSNDGLTRFVQDFYSYEVDQDGRPVSPLGSHVNAHTAGSMIEGGYLGFAGLLYGHMPLPGESLVTFLSDGAFEEQRGSDWTPRWWRQEDTGYVVPIMIANGRRIDQRTTMAQSGGAQWLAKHLQLNGFDPIFIDGRDPAAHAWAVIEMEERQAACSRALKSGELAYPIPVPYGIAETIKGFGFPGAGTNRAHNLPLEGNPRHDNAARSSFNDGASRLWVEPRRLSNAVENLNNHTALARSRERDHPLVARPPTSVILPEYSWREPGSKPASPMAAVDECFEAIVATNPELRVRVGNPDEMRSNRMNKTLDLLKHRVTAPEAGVSEATDGSVITALNEEAVICSALANKAGISLAVSYEAFAVKMLGALRQDLIFTRNLIESGRLPYWPGLPVIATSHVWENGKNELSHQDPTLAEAMWGEMSDLSRVVFPVDWNSAIACLQECYRTRGTVWTMVAPKRDVPVVLDWEQAERAVRLGGIRIRECTHGDPELLLIASGTYQLQEILKASDRLTQRKVPHIVNLLIEPGRFRAPRDEMEEKIVTPVETVEELFPASIRSRVFVSHTRPEPYCGLLRPLDTGPKSTFWLGFSGKGGTLDTDGLLFANKSTWAHVVEAAAKACHKPVSELLTGEELEAITNVRPPRGVLFGDRQS